MTTIERLVGTAVCALALAGPVTAFAQAGAAPAAPVKATVEQLAWVSGAYTGMLGDRTIEQHWSAPLGGSIIAMYRSIQANKATLYELLAIEQEGANGVLRIKHFAPGPGLVARRPKDESVNQTPGQDRGPASVFEGGTPPRIRVRITFRSPEAGDV